MLVLKLEAVMVKELKQKLEMKLALGIASFFINVTMVSKVEYVWGLI